MLARKWGQPFPNTPLVDMVIDLMYNRPGRTQGGGRRLRPGK